MARAGSTESGSAPHMSRSVPPRFDSPSGRRRQRIRARRHPRRGPAARARVSGSPADPRSAVGKAEAPGLRRGCFRARPDPAEGGDEAARGRAELDRSRRFVSGSKRESDVTSDSRDPHGPVLLDGNCARALPDLERSPRSARCGGGCATAVRSIRPRTTRRHGRPRSRWSATWPPASTALLRARIRARIELLHAVGASEPDRVPVDRDRRRGSEAVRERLRVARRRIDPRDLPACPLESPDGAVADCELDRIERTENTVSRSLEDDPVAAIRRAPARPRAR